MHFVLYFIILLKYDLKTYVRHESYMIQNPLNFCKILSDSVIFSSPPGILTGNLIRC